MNVVYHPADQTYRVGGRVFTAQVVAEMLMTRPYEKLTGSELSRVQNVETTFRVGADGRPEAVTRLVDKPSKASARNGGESELAWLKRRVDEICWSPR